MKVHWLLFSVLITLRSIVGDAQESSASASVFISPEQETERSLFNGETLDGWQVVSRNPVAAEGLWTVVEGAIQCDSRANPPPDYVWLVCETECDDFILTLDFQCPQGSSGNSGVQFRSRFAADLDGGWMHGPQVDIAPADPWRSGWIYDETHAVQRWLQPAAPDWQLKEDQAWPQGLPQDWSFHFAHEQPAWNQLRIEASGQQIRTFLNGVAIADYNGTGELDDAVHRAAGVGQRGHLALQLHAHDRLLIRFRNLVLREVE